MPVTSTGVVHPYETYGNFSVMHESDSPPTNADAKNSVGQKPKRGCSIGPKTFACLFISLAAISLTTIALLIYFAIRASTLEHEQSLRRYTTGSNASHGTAIVAVSDSAVAGHDNAVVSVPAGASNGIAIVYDSTAVPRVAASDHVNSTQPNATSLSASSSSEAFRLPTALSPILYTLTLKSYVPSPVGILTFSPDRNFTFDGDLSLLFHCWSDTTEIVLNSAELNYSSIDEASNWFHLELVARNVSNSTSRAIQLKSVSTNDDDETVTFRLADKLQAGRNYSLRIQYVGQIREQFSGYYRSHYTMDAGEERWLSVTQFEPADARRALPCFDEPAFKARFKLTLIHPSDLNAIANTEAHPVHQNSSGWSTTEFDVSLRMSSYLLAFSLNDFPYRDGSHDRIKFRIYAPPDKMNATDFALKFGPSVLRFYEDYFGINYPLPKLDFMAVPDFDAGAMENWGLITYNEATLLYDERPGSSNTLQDKLLVAKVIAHETAHQWFGNLVTLRWWNDIWLNEGFATYMEYIAADHILGPKWRLFDHFVVDAVHYGMEQDQSASTHPISSPYKTIAEIQTAFDSISYSKSALILRMVNFTIGEGAFRKGVIEYLNKHKFTNTENADLWRSLNEVLEKEPIRMKDWNGDMFNLERLANPWVLQAGFPAVTVDCDFVSNQCKLTQERFTVGSNTTNDKYSDQGYGYKWPVPIWSMTKSNRNLTFSWLKPDSASIITIPKGVSTNTAADAEWLLVNPDARGFFRTNYNENGWRRIQKQLFEDHLAFSPATRAQLLADAFNFVKSDKLPYEVALNLSTYLIKERDGVPWQAFQNALDDLIDKLMFTKDFGYLKAYMKSILTDHYNHVGWQGNGIDKDDVFAESFHTFVVSYACNFDVPQCLQDTEKAFRSFVESCAQSLANIEPCSSNNIPAALRRTAYCQGLRRGSESDFFTLWNAYQIEPNDAEQQSLLAGLSCTETAWLISRLLYEVIHGDTLRTMDAGSLFMSIASNPIGAKFVWPTFLTEWDSIFQKYAFGGGSTMWSIVEGATSTMRNDHQIQELTSFMEDHKEDIEDVKQDLESGIEAAKLRIAWAEQNYDEVVQWFKSRTKLAF